MLHIRVAMLCGTALVAASTLAQTATSQAADMRVLPRKAPPKAVVEAPLWDGVFYGAHIGYAWGADTTAVMTSQFDRIGTGLFSSTSPEARDDGSSFIQGVHVRRDYQRGSMVYGIEADLTKASIKGETGVVSAVAVPNGQGRAFGSGDALSSIDWYGTVRARLGMALPNRTLIYATAGLAYGKVDLHGAVGLGGSTGGGPNGPYSLLSGFHESKIRAGWVVGAGVEHQSRIWNNAILSLAYQYVDLGEINVTQTVSATGTDGTARGILNASADASFHVIRAGASWRMGQSPYNAYASADRRAPAAFGWSGFYIGAHAGGIWSANDLMDGVTATANLTGSPSATGVAPGASDSSWLFGTQAGYNFQSGPIVYGVEVDGSVTKLNAASGNASARINPAGQPDVTALAEAGASLGWLSTIRGRLGYAFGPTLVYGTGGLAIGKVNFHGSTNVGGSVGGGPAGNQGQYASFSESSVEVGWTAGAGIDYQLRNNWILNLAYQYVDLGDISATRTASITNGGTTGSATVDAKTNLTFHTARVGISWRN